MILLYLLINVKVIAFLGFICCLILSVYLKVSLSHPNHKFETTISHEFLKVTWGFLLTSCRPLNPHLMLEFWVWPFHTRDQRVDAACSHDLGDSWVPGRHYLQEIKTNEVGKWFPRCLELWISSGTAKTGHQSWCLSVSAFSSWPCSSLKEHCRS